MTVYVTEHAGYPHKQALGHPLTAYALTSASTAPFPAAGTKFIRVSADGGSYLKVDSTSSTAALTSTNAFRIPANVAPELIGVTTTAKIQAAST